MIVSKEQNTLYVPNREKINLFFGNDVILKELFVKALTAHPNMRIKELKNEEYDELLRTRTCIPFA